MSLRQQIVQAVQVALKEIRDPKPVLVTVEPFETEKLAITQFPALLVQFRDETRESVSMGPPGVGRRTGQISIDVRGFVRGTELDRRRNDLINAVENALDADRYLGLRTAGVMDTQIVTIEVIDRLAPLAEIRVVVDVNYTYIRGAQ
jgi:hypothetical protein